MAEQRMSLLVEGALELPEPRLDQLILFDGADALIADGGVRRAPADPQAERQRAGLRGDDPQPGGLEHEGGVGAVTALRHREAPDAAVFFAHYALHHQASPKWDPAFLQRRSGADGDRQPGLHVTRAAPIEAAGMDMCRPGRGVPGLAV